MDTKKNYTIMEISNQYYNQESELYNKCKKTEELRNLCIGYVIRNLCINSENHFHKVRSTVHPY